MASSAGGACPFASVSSGTGTVEQNRDCSYYHVAGIGVGGPSNRDWWPDQLNLDVLHRNNEKTNDDDDNDDDYATAFESLDLDALQRDLRALMTSSVDWWPADYGHYGPLFIRLAWHSAGTYRVTDGRGGARGGQIRYAPLNSWPDNGNLDKARRLLLPIKLKYGKYVSWADLIVLAGNVALSSMGFEPLGFAGGRRDVYRPEDYVNWGLETKWLDNKRRYHQNGTKVSGRKLDEPLAAVQMGLIYVNPEGPDGNPDPLASAGDIRETFGRMSMNDYETVALIAGGHTFGKCHGAGDPARYVGPEPEGAPLEQTGLGWKNTLGGNGNGKGGNTITSGIEGAWTSNPTVWDHGYFTNLFQYDWKLTKSPAGAHQWIPNDNNGAAGAVPDAHDARKRHPPMMTTADMALRADPAYRKIALHFKRHPEEFASAFAAAWYKLTHRDMGPYPVRFLGSQVPPVQPWQDALPPPSPNGGLLTDEDATTLKRTILESSGLSLSRLVTTAWASACTFRGSDLRGGANGARIRLSPQKDWPVNDPVELSKALSSLERIQRDFNNNNNKYVSMADLIVLGGCAAVEAAARAGGCNEDVCCKAPFTPGRVDATQDTTDVESFAALEPVADGFRNYVGDALQASLNDGTAKPNVVEALLVDKAQLLNLTVPEMTVLVGGLRVLGVTGGGGGGSSGSGGNNNHGVWTDRVGVLSNDFFKRLLDTNACWEPVAPNLYRATTRHDAGVAVTGTAATATRVDLIFASHSVLRAWCEVYAAENASNMFRRDFCKAFAKVMDLDRFDVREKQRRQRKQRRNEKQKRREEHLRSHL